MAGAGAAVGNYHNIVSQSLSLLSLFLSLSLCLHRAAANRTKQKTLSAPQRPFLMCATWQGRTTRGKKELGSFQSRGIGIGIGYVQLLELPCTYLHWATTVNWHKNQIVHKNVYFPLASKDLPQHNFFSVFLDAYRWSSTAVHSGAGTLILQEEGS